jgi:hypothetical protein
MTPEEILEEVKANFGSGARRRFLPGLLIAFIKFIKTLEANGGRFGSLVDFHKAFPIKTVTSAGKAANTLIVVTKSGTLSIRPFYNEIESWFRNEQQRFDYPSAAPHATQSWTGYTHWLESLLPLSDAELAELDAQARAFVLSVLPSQGVDPSTIHREPPLFHLFLERFDLAAHPGETTGAAYQGTVFAYIRADAPHLQVEVGKVRTGSKREKRVGDVDARDGNMLVLSAEVKQYTVTLDALPEFAEFANLISQHKALGLVVALDFAPGVREGMVKLGLSPVSRNDLIERVRLWDPLKQKIAMNALLYYVDFREQSSALTSRVKAFVQQIEVGTEI